MPRSELGTRVILWNSGLRILCQMRQRTSLKLTLQTLRRWRRNKLQRTSEWQFTPAYWKLRGRVLNANFKLGNRFFRIKEYFRSHRESFAAHRVLLSGIFKPKMGVLSETIELTPDNIVIFEFPAYIRDDYRPMMSALYAQGEITSMPNFVLPSMKGEIAPVPFDSNKFSRDQKMAVAEATKLIGWNAREVADDVFITEYYYLHRFLLFERFKLEVRESILSKLNEAIARTGKKLGFTGQIVVEGLPSLAVIEDAQQGLEQGDRKFNDIMKPFHSYA